MEVKLLNHRLTGSYCFSNNSDWRHACKDRCLDVGKAPSVGFLSGMGSR